jgi:hypothetical protein
MRRLKMAMLLLAGVCFLIPVLGKTSSARPVKPAAHSPHVQHQQPLNASSDDDGAVPCAP